MEFLRDMEPGSVDLVLTDPPYYGIAKEPWDHQWETQTEYLDWLGRAADQWRRVLRPNGSIYVFASPRMAARVECLIAERFNVLNSITWQKDFPCGALKYGPENFRGFVEMSERIIFAEQYGSDEHADQAAGYTDQSKAARRAAFGEPIRLAMQAAGVNGREVAESLGLYGKVNHGGIVSNWLSGHNEPTEGQWERLAEYFRGFGCDGALLGQKNGTSVAGLDAVRRRYRELRRPFFARLGAPCTDVWTFKPVSQVALVHPCEKPLPLLEHILESSSVEGAVVMDSFAGSGSTGLACLRIGRRFIGIERDPTYFAIAEKRIAAAEREVVQEAAFFGQPTPDLFATEDRP